MYRKDQRLHFIGIGGIGMAGLAEVLLNLGYRVTGSDIHRSELTRRLELLGCGVSIKHAAAHVEGADVAVVSAAIPEGNVEVLEARRRGIPVIERAEMLAELMRIKYGIAVAGAHGKTTTASMIADTLAQGGFDPTAVIGGLVKRLGTGAKLGEGDFMVAEADESDGSFLRLTPTIAVVTNIDREHLDHYRSLNALCNAFFEFVERVPFYGVSILCLDERNVQRLLPQLKRRHMTYGFSSQADIVITDYEDLPMSSRFSVQRKREKLGTVRLRMPGRHNALNAAAAVAVGLELDMPFDAIRDALEAFEGVERRFELHGEAKGVLVIDDYAHHPTEIRATLAAARSLGRRILVAFQPHRYTRARDLRDEFLSAFNDADVLIVTEIYAAGEEAIPGVSGAAMFEGIRRFGHKNIHFATDAESILALASRLARPGDLLITMGAGDIGRLAPRILEELSK